MLFAKWIDGRAHRPIKRGVTISNIDIEIATLPKSLRDQNREFAYPNF